MTRRFQRTWANNVWAGLFDCAAEGDAFGMRAGLRTAALDLPWGPP